MSFLAGIQNKLVKLVEDAQKSVEVVLTAEKEAQEVLFSLFKGFLVF